ncbi:FUSC family protein [Caulobacter sp. 17J80-11]|uniref:FUSC family protein n=1 Tax=Caulobacter sp. 17J80-11 TaxID=2763502 RepID=UPI00165385BF|nr:FUSC family protein [Caulobacter sp. 17J80-11]MBC6982542.1 FUSC family protein [Caulobacter sp. 17J80-11]
MVDELECVASVLLAIVFGRLAGGQHIAWAAFAGYMVMRGHVADSLRRGLLRIVGTVGGAMLAWAHLELLGAEPVRSAVALAAVGGATLYAALTTKRSYAWLFVGLTFAAVVLDRVEHPDAPVVAQALVRVTEVVAGTLACVLVSALSTMTLRRRWPGSRKPDPKAEGWRPEAARHAAQAAIALATLPLIRLVWPLPELAQAAVAIMAVMMVPVSGIGASGLAPVSRRIGLRVAGCAAGAAVAAAFLLVSRGSPAVLIAGTMVGVILGRHIENGASSVAYAGTQFVLAVLVALVPDDYANPDLSGAWGRLAATLIGLCLIEPVLVAWHVLAPRRPPTSVDVRSEPGEV